MHAAHRPCGAARVKSANVWIILPVPGLLSDACASPASPAAGTVCAEMSIIWTLQQGAASKAACGSAGNHPVLLSLTKHKSVVVAVLNVRQ